SRLPRTLRSTPFPSTTLFRSRPGLAHGVGQVVRDRSLACPTRAGLCVHPWGGGIGRVLRVGGSATTTDRDERCRRDHRYSEPSRSEEHTSELQSRENLVCRLL